MSHVVDLQFKRTTKMFARDTISAFTLAYKVPQCKLMQDFLSHAGLPWQACYILSALTHEQIGELHDALSRLHQKIIGERYRLCRVYGVEDPDTLPSQERLFFDAALRAFVEKEDHYP